MVVLQLQLDSENHLTLDLVLYLLLVEKRTQRHLRYKKIQFYSDSLDLLFRTSRSDNQQTHSFLSTFRAKKEELIITTETLLLHSSLLIRVLLLLLLLEKITVRLELLRPPVKITERSYTRKLFVLRLEQSRSVVRLLTTSLLKMHILVLVRLLLPAQQKQHLFPTGLVLVYSTSVVETSLRLLHISLVLVDYSRTELLEKQLQKHTISPLLLSSLQKIMVLSLLLLQPQKTMV